MILGHGIDLINENRIEDILYRHGRRFEEKYFSESEINRAKENYRKRFSSINNVARNWFN